MLTKFFKTAIFLVYFQTVLTVYFRNVYIL